MIQELQLTKSQKYNLLLTFAIGVQMTVVNNEPADLSGYLTELEDANFAHYDDRLYEELNPLGYLSPLEVLDLIRNMASHLEGHEFRDILNSLSGSALMYIADHISRLETCHLDNPKAQSDSLARIASQANLFGVELDSLSPKKEFITWRFTTDFRHSKQGRIALENVRNCPNISQEAS